MKHCGLAFTCMWITDHISPPHIRGIKSSSWDHTHVPHSSFSADTNDLHNVEDKLINSDFIYLLNIKGIVLMLKHICVLCDWNRYPRTTHQQHTSWTRFWIYWSQNSFFTYMAWSIAVYTRRIRPLINESLEAPLTWYLTRFPSLKCGIWINVIIIIWKRKLASFFYEKMVIKLWWVD